MLSFQKYLIFIAVLILLGACSSTTKRNENFRPNQFKTVMLPKLSGDTSDYVYKRLLNELSLIPSLTIITNEAITEEAKRLNLTRELRQQLPSALQKISLSLEAQGFFTGRIASGATTISESSRVHTSIELTFFDAKSGEKVLSSLEEDEAIVLWERRSSLKDATDKSVEHYKKFFETD